MSWVRYWGWGESRPSRKLGRDLRSVEDAPRWRSHLGRGKERQRAHLGANGSSQRVGEKQKSVASVKPWRLSSW